MTTIRPTKNEGCKVILFPDNQPHVNIGLHAPDENFRVVMPIRSPAELFQLMLVANAIDNQQGVKRELVIPYLMGARYDRVMADGDSWDLFVVANAINSLHFGSVNLFDVHSPESTRLILNSKSHNNSRLLEAYHGKNVILIIPDKGATARLDLYKSKLDVKDVVFCEKVRDLTNGRITLKVLEPEKCEGQTCVIVDDLCDGGGTFLAIAQQIRAKDLTLIVSHGIFSKGLGELSNHFHEIITSDSYASHPTHRILTTIPLNL